LQSRSEHLSVAWRAPAKFCNYPSPSIHQYIAVYLVGSSMPTLDSWLRHLANPHRRIFSVTITGFLHSLYFSVTYNTKSKQKKVKQTTFMHKNTTIYVVWSTPIFVVKIPLQHQQ